MREPKQLESRRLMGWLCHLLLVTVTASCSKVSLDPVSSGQSGAGGESGAGGQSGATGNETGAEDRDASIGPGGGGSENRGGSGGEAIDDAGPDVEPPPEEPTPYWVDGGFATAECSGAPPPFDAGAGDAGDAGDSPFELADRDCDGLADSCSVDGDCASENLVAQYLFEQNVRDATPYANDASDVSGVSYAGGVGGEALVLGASSVASVPRSGSLAFTDALTLELWVQPSALPPGGGRAGLFDDDGRYGLFITSLGELRCVAGGGSLSGGALTVDQWAHVACVLDASTLTLWQDGHMRAQAPRSGNLATPGQSPLIIGGNAPSGDRFEGLLDNLRIWREARSPSQLSRAAQTRQ